MKLRHSALLLVAAGLVVAASGCPVSSVSPARSFELVASALSSVNGKIAFVDCPARAADCEIAVIGPDGRGWKQLTSNKAEEEYPTWSPDGKKIAFNSDQSTVWDIWVMNADGTRQRNLTKDAHTDWNPAWSPDGKRIAFTSDRDPANSNIYVMNADGSGLESFPRDRLLNDGQPAWSPDGTKIAFTACTRGVPELGCEIYVMNADGSGRTNLTDDPNHDAWPAWSPDGTQIAFHSDRDVNYEIYVMNADGSGQTNVSMNDATDFEPSWSPDGSKIAFSTNRPDTQIHIMNADGTGLPRNLTGDEQGGDGIEFWHSWGPEPQPPQTRLTGAPQRVSTDRTPTFRFRSDDPAARFRCKLDSRRYRSCDSPKTYGPLPFGKHTFRVKAIDAVGTSDPTPVSFRWSIRP